ncbi:DUF7079 family protein [Dokdonella sp.]|uniref:DUF7079 family protein n=1 Tax=Dokdonella sp. TaxID=2291710 RepID=UPI003C48FDCB
MLAFAGQASTVPRCAWGGVFLSTPVSLPRKRVAMVEPSLDLTDRVPIWDELQHFWMDSDPEDQLQRIADACAESKYAIEELEAIFWNEVRPALSFNLWGMPAPEWRGFEKEWLKTRVLKKHRFGRPVPPRWLHRYANSWWGKLQVEIVAARVRHSG